MKSQIKFNKFQKTIIKRANVLAKHNFEPQITFFDDKHALISFSVIRENRNALHFIKFTKTSKSTAVAKSYYEFTDDNTTIAAPIPVEKNNILLQIKNTDGVYKLNF